MTAGIAFALSFPKSPLFFLAFVFFTPLLLAVENRGPAAHFRIFFSFSFVSSLIILYWIPRVMVKYGGTTWMLGIVGLISLAGYLSVFSGLAGLAIGYFSRHGMPPSAPLWLPAIWVAKDLAVEKVFSGFPWCLAGYSQHKNIYFSQWSELGGIHLVSFLVISINILFFKWLKTRSKKALFALAGVVCAIHAAGYGLLQNSAAKTSAIPRHLAGIIQPNCDHDRIHDFASINRTLEGLFTTSLQLKKAGAEFVVWPEFTVPIYPLQTPFFRKRFTTFTQNHIPLFAGFTDYQSSEKVYNSMMLFNGRQLEKYDKVHLTPFGEYVLFRRWLFFVKKITDEIGDFTPGGEVHNIRFSGHGISTPICYEVIYPELVRSMVARGGEVIITISNDSWFGKSSAPYQHLAMAVFRSIENRRWLLRSTSNGISALVDPAGHIVHQAPLHEPHEFLARFQYLSGRTVFNRWGYLFPYACLLLVMGKLLWILAGKGNRRHQP